MKSNLRRLPSGQVLHFRTSLALPALQEMSGDISRWTVTVSFVYSIAVYFEVVRAHSFKRGTERIRMVRSVVMLSSTEYELLVEWNIVE